MPVNSEQQFPFQFPGTEDAVHEAEPPFKGIDGCADNDPKKEAACPQVAVRL